MAIRLMYWLCEGLQVMGDTLLYGTFRSGNGAHVWIFFGQPVPVVKARKLGFALLTHAMERDVKLTFKSYDRLFPNQDYLPEGGLGNLVALPLQGQARKLGNSVFVDEDFVVFKDQWSKSDENGCSCLKRWTGTGTSGKRKPHTGYRISAHRRWIIELNSIHASKGNALCTLCKKLGISMENVLAIGDNENDISMLQAAGISAAMENAEDDVKQAAKFVAGHNEEDGAAHFLEEWVL